MVVGKLCSKALWRRTRTKEFSVFTQGLSMDPLSEKQKKPYAMFSSYDRKKYARNMLVPLIENEVKKRKKITAITDDQMASSLKDVLEEIANAVEADKDLGLA